MDTIRWRGSTGVQKIEHVFADGSSRAIYELANIRMTPPAACYLQLAGAINRLVEDVDARFTSERLYMAQDFNGQVCLFNEPPFYAKAGKAWRVRERHRHTYVREIFVGSWLPQIGEYAITNKNWRETLLTDMTGAFLETLQAYIGKYNARALQQQPFAIAIAKYTQHRVLRRKIIEQRSKGDKR